MDVTTKNLPKVVPPKLVFSPHPLCPVTDRWICYEGFLIGESIGQYFDRVNLQLSRPQDYIIFLNDRTLTLNECETQYPSNNDLIVVRACLHGGDSDGGKVLRTALTVGVIIASSGAGGLWAGGMFGGGALGSALGPAIVQIGGMLAINALIPIKPPSVDEEEPSPTYALSGSKNRARLSQPMPIVLGTVRFYPDHGANPYTDYEGLDQYFLQVFNFGLSNLDFDLANPTYNSFKLGETDLIKFDIDLEDPAQFELSDGFTGTINNYPTTVNSIAGGDLIGLDNVDIDTFIERRSATGVNKLEVGITAVNYWFNSSQGLRSARIHLVIEYKDVSSSTWLPFFKNPDTNTVEIINGKREVIHLDYQLIDLPLSQYDVQVKLRSDGQKVEGTRPVCLEEVDGWCEVYDTTLPQYQYVEYGVNGDKMSQQVNFDVLRSYEPDLNTDYTDQVRAVLRIKASGQLNGSVDSFNFIAKSIIPAYNGSTYVDGVSSNPADQFLFIAKGKFRANGIRLYGAGLAESRIDLANLQSWWQWCNDKSLECNIVFDSKISVNDMLNTIARCGRATSTWSGGLLGVIFDKADKPEVSVFGMSNILRDSFEVNYVTNNQVDQVVVEFNNEDPLIGYKRDTISADVPFVGTPTNVMNVYLKGITNKEQAGKEANLIAAEQYYRRRIISFESDMEGLTVKRGEVAILSHDLTSWGYSGRLLSGTTTVVVLDKEVPFNGSNHYINIRFPNGNQETKLVNVQGGPSNTLTLVSPLTKSPDDDVNNIPMDYIWVFDVKETPGKKIKITQVQPINEHQVKITCTDEEDAYYLAEDTTPDYINPEGVLGTLPVISNLKLRESLSRSGDTYTSIVNVSWQITSGTYGGAVISARELGGDTIPWIEVGRTLDKTFAFPYVQDVFLEVRVLTFNLSFDTTDESVATATMWLAGKSAPPTAITTFNIGSVAPNVVNLHWNFVDDLDLARYEVHASTVNNRANAFLAFSVPANGVEDNTVNHHTEVPLWYWIKTVDTTGNDSTWFPVGDTDGSPGTPDGLTSLGEWEDIIGKPYDSDIYNTLSYRNGFEEEYLAWQVKDPEDTLTQDTTNQSGGFSGHFTSTLTAPSAGSGTDRTYVRIPLTTSLSFYGKRVRVFFYHKQPASNPSLKFAVSATTNGDGNSGWIEFDNNNTTSKFVTESFLWDVFPLTAASGFIDLAIWADTLGGGGGVLIDSIVIAVVDDIGDLSGTLEFGEIAGTDNLHNTFYRDSDPTIDPIGPDFAKEGDYLYNAALDPISGLPKNRLKQVQDTGGGVLAWVKIQDSQIANALADADDAQTTADGKIVTYFNHATNDGVPVADGKGDVWYNEETNWTRYSASVAGANFIGTGGWEPAIGADTNWTSLFGDNKPADNADVSTPTKCLVQHNSETFGGTDGGYGYVCGVGANGQIADIPAIVYYNGFAVPIYHTTTNEPSTGPSNFRPNIACEGYIIHYPEDQGSFADGRQYAVGFPSEAGSTTDWTVYYSGAENTINVNAGHVVIGTARFNNSTNLASSVIWGYGISTSEVTSYLADITNYEDYRVSNSREADSVLTIDRPQGGRFSSDANGATGALVITLPDLWLGTNVKFEVDVATDDGVQFIVYVGGVLDPSEIWSVGFAQIAGNISADNTVRFSKSGAGKPVVIIGTGASTWDKLKVEVRNFRAGTAGFAYTQWDDFWSVLLDGSLTGYTHYITHDDNLLDSQSVKGEGVITTLNIGNRQVTELLNLYDNSNDSSNSGSWTTLSNFQIVISDETTLIDASISYTERTESTGSSSIYCTEYRIIRISNSVTTVLRETTNYCAINVETLLRTVNYREDLNLPVETHDFHIQIRNDGANTVGSSAVLDATYTMLLLKR